MHIFDQGPNRKLTLHYPRTSHVGFLHHPDFAQRTFEILQIRDLVRQPLTPEDYLRRPFVRRSRYLAIAREQGKYRQFYLGCSLEYQAPSQLRLALYAPDSQRPCELLARPFESDPRDRKVLLRLLARLQQKSFGQLQLRIFADDLRVIVGNPTT
jgi:hypothetical protein